MKNNLAPLCLLVLSTLVPLLQSHLVAQDSPPTGYRIDSLVREGLSVAADHYRNSLAELAFGQGYPASIIERGADAGELKTVDADHWVSGFYPGTLWYLYEATGEERFGAAARQWTAGLAANQTNTTTHDLGFMLQSSFGNGYRLTGDPSYRDVLLRGAGSLSSRFNEQVGAIKSWDWGHWLWTFPVIIDNLMNLELLTSATQLGGPLTYLEQAKSHADVTLSHHFRDDYSSYHVVDLDPSSGAVIKKLTYQGIADSSMWARGQAWAIYGYTMMYRETDDARYLESARRVLTPFVDRLPGDYVPYWDFDDPAIPAAPKDASAAAIVASALLELHVLTGEEGAPYLRLSENILGSLLSPTYLARPGENANFILKHATGNKPAGREIDVPLTYADYYLVEALLRYRNLAAAYDDRLGTISLVEDTDSFVVVEDFTALLDEPRPVGGYRVRVENFNEQLDFSISGDELHVTPATDYYGSSQGVLFLDFADTSRVFRFEVRVLPVNDAPAAFRLTAPPDGSELSSTNVLFRWEAAGDSDGDTLTYDFHLSTTGWDTLISALTEPKLRLVGEGILRSGATYTWYATAADGELSTAASDTFRFVAPLVVATKAVPSAAVLRVYPNPFTHSIHFDPGGAGGLGWVRVEIRDSAGKLQLSTAWKDTGGEQVIDASGLAPGPYLYHLCLPDGSSVRAGKLIKAKPR